MRALGDFFPHCRWRAGCWPVAPTMSRDLSGPVATNPSRGDDHGQRPVRGNIRSPEQLLYSDCLGSTASRRAACVDSRSPRVSIGSPCARRSLGTFYGNIPIRDVKFTAEAAAATASTPKYCCGFYLGEFDLTRSTSNPDAEIAQRCRQPGPADRPVSEQAPRKNAAAVPWRPGPPPHPTLSSARRNAVSCEERRCGTRRDSSRSCPCSACFGRLHGGAATYQGPSGDDQNAATVAAGPWPRAIR